MEEFIAGRHPVQEALRSGRTIHKIWIAESAQGVHSILQEAKQQAIIVQTVDRRKLDSLAANTQHQGIVAQIASYDYAELDQLLTSALNRTTPPLFLILDEIEDPHNLGSILRSADCTGVDGIIIPKRRSVGLTMTVAKTSAGAIEYVPVARVGNIAQTIEELKKAGIWIAGADASAKQDVYQTDLTMPLAIVIGNEHKGIGQLIKKKCDFLIKLPMAGRINSLNASVAAAVLLYETVRQRSAK